MGNIDQYGVGISWEYHGITICNHIKTEILQILTGHSDWEISDACCKKRWLALGNMKGNPRTTWRMAGKIIELNGGLSVAMFDYQWVPEMQGFFWD